MKLQAKSNTAYWFLGIGRDDTLAIGQKLIDKILKYRIFDDEQGKWAGTCLKQMVESCLCHNLP